MNFNILQFNVRRSPSVMLLLSADSLASPFDIIAIQEPAQKSNCFSTYCDSRSEFISLYPTTQDSRTSFFINRRLSVSTWSVEFIGNTLSLLHLTLPSHRVTVINVYNPPLASQLDADNPIAQLPALMQDQSVAYVLMGDFNLHNPSWSQARERRLSPLSGDLIQHTDHANLHLATPPGLTTFQRSPTSASNSTIDLAFISHSIHHRITECHTRPLLQHGSDHVPIATCFAFTKHHSEHNNRPHKIWKHMDHEAVCAGSRYLLIPSALTPHRAIDDYARYLQTFILQLSDVTVPQSTSRTASTTPRCAWWTQDVRNAISNERRAIRHRLPFQQVRSLNRVKKSAVARARRTCWRQAVHEAKDGTRGIWALTKWAKDRSDIPSEPPKVPPLEGQQPEQRVDTFEEKCEAFHRQFFPPTPDADLSDMSPAEYPPDLDSLPIISYDTVSSVVRRTSPFKAPGVDGIPTGFLQAMGEPLVCALQLLAQSSWNWAHFPRPFRTAKTIVLRKPRKASYSSPKSWRPIALLSTLGKVIESITASYLQKLAEDHSLLPTMQMGARQGRSTDTALDVLVYQIRGVWAANGVASLLSLDMSGAFDRVVKSRLIYNMKKKGVPKTLCSWISSFMSDRTTTFAFDGLQSESMPISAGIPQGSPLSPILFLFYNADLINDCHGPSTSALGFVDDVNILVWSQSTAKNCRILSAVHNRCLSWASRHGASFAPDKYELIHFSRARTRYDLTQALNLGHIIKQPSPSVRVLSLHLDTKLQWRAHKEVLLQKLERQTRALTKLTGSTWGLPLIYSRQAYTAIIRLVKTYASHVWHQPLPHRKRKDCLTSQLSIVQNQCLRSLTGAFRATPIPAMENLAFIPPLDIYLTTQTALYRKKARDQGVDLLRDEICSRIFSDLRPRSRHLPNFANIIAHSHPVDPAWVDSWLDLSPSPPPSSHKLRLEVTSARWLDRWHASPPVRSTSLPLPPPHQKPSLYIAASTKRNHPYTPKS